MIYSSGIETASPYQVQVFADSDATFVTNATLKAFPTLTFALLDAPVEIEEGFYKLSFKGGGERRVRLEQHPVDGRTTVASWHPTPLIPDGVMPSYA